MVLSPGRVVAVGLLSCGTACASVSSDEDPADEAPYVVATTSIWADVASLVACDGTFEVRTLVPPGGDAHAYEPSLRDREVLDGAALVVANGLGLEELLEDTIEDVAAGGVPIFTVAEHVDTIPDDPHVWFDPRRVRSVLAPLGDALITARGEPGIIERCVERAAAALTEVDAELESTLGAIAPERRLLVTNHDSLGYLADRYGFTIVGSVLPSASTLTEASPAQLEALGEQIKELEVPAIFTESLHESEDAEELAERLGVDVVELHTDALGGPDSEAATYTDLLRTDAERIAGALGE